jgi:hypothetical protein
MDVCGVDFQFVEDEMADLNREKVNNHRMAPIIAPVLEAGFTVEELVELQSINDNNDNEDIRNTELLTAIDKMKEDK